MQRAHREEALLDLVGDFYQAAMEPAHWSVVIAKVHTVVKCAGVLLYAVDHRMKEVPLAITHNFSDKMLREGKEHYFQNSPRLACSLAHRDRPVCDYMHIREAEIDRSEHYAWLRREGGFRYYIGAALAEIDDVATYISLQRAPEHGHVDQEEIDTFARLLPHLKKSVTLSTVFRGLRACIGEVSSALHTFGIAVILLDQRGRVVFMSEAAEQIVARANGLLVDRSGRVRAVQADEGRRLGRAIATATGSLSREYPPVVGECLVSRASGREPLRLSVSPARDSDAAIASVPLGATLIIHDPDTRQQPGADRLCQRYGLTKTESQLAVALSEGASLRSYANGNGISYETARWHLKRVLAKTETHRQAELVSLVLQNRSVVH